jgi:hypothetical protein
MDVASGTTAKNYWAERKGAQRSKAHHGYILKEISPGSSVHCNKTRRLRFARKKGCPQRKMRNGRHTYVCTKTHTQTPPIRTQTLDTLLKVEKWRVYHRAEWSQTGASNRGGSGFAPVTPRFQCMRPGQEIRNLGKSCFPAFRGLVFANRGPVSGNIHGFSDNQPLEKTAQSNWHENEALFRFPRADMETRAPVP